MSKPVAKLSKGYRQRVGMAQALLHDPEVLILDEPTSGLDPLQIREVRSLIRELGRSKTILLSTHILARGRGRRQRGHRRRRGPPRLRRHPRRAARRLHGRGALLRAHGPQEKEAA
jgi:predicted ABC-type transport system involved in lysophospholipase L1 biosynthesis ATPase subunit